MAAAVPVPVLASTGYPVNNDWRNSPKTIVAREKMMEIVSKTMQRILGILNSEAVKHTAAVENELFFRANSLHDYIDMNTLNYRISVTSHRLLEGCHAVPMPMNTVSHAGPGNLTRSLVNPGSFLPQLTGGEHPASESYWQGTSGAVLISDFPPPLSTSAAAHLVPSVGSLSSRVPLDPPSLFIPGCSPNGNATFYNHSLPPNYGSVYRASAPPNHVQAPHWTPFNNNFAGGLCSRDRDVMNFGNVLNVPWTDQSGASVRNYQQSGSNRFTTQATPAPLVTYPTDYPVFRAYPSSGRSSNPPCPPSDSALNGGWAIPQNYQRGFVGLPSINYSSGIPGGQYQQSTLGADVRDHQEEPLNYDAVHGYVDCRGVAPGSSSRFGDSSRLPIGTFSGAGINNQEGTYALQGPSFANHLSESAAHQLHSTEQSVAVPARQQVRGISTEHIVQNHEATPTSAADFGVQYPVSQAAVSHGSSPTFSDSRCLVAGAVNSEEVILEGSKEARDGLSFGKGSSQCEATAVLWPTNSAEQYRQGLQGMINNTGYHKPTMENLPSPVASIVGTSDAFGLLKKHEWADERLPSLQRVSESQLHDVSVLNESATIILSDDDESEPMPEVGPVHVEEIPDSSTVDDSKIDPALEEPLNCYELKVPSKVEFMDEGEGMPYENLEAQPSSEDTDIPTEDEKTGVRPAPGDETLEDAILETENNNSESSTTDRTNLPCVSMTESFSEEEILEHLSDLGNPIGKGCGDEATKSFSENICRLCGEEKIFFEMDPCSQCGNNMRKNAVYYSFSDKEGDLRLCRPCYDQSGKKINYGEKTLDKGKLRKKITKKGTEEDWVQCDMCQGWQHQICTFYNQAVDTGGKAKYICPLCCIKELRSGERLPSEAGVLRASNLPRTALSDHIEQRLLTRLREDRELRAKDQGKGFLEVPGAEDLRIRVVQEEKKKLQVKEEFLDLFNPTDYPSEFTYDSKMILLFQKIGVADVILFGFYAEEYGPDCGDPNSRCIYISYIDSIKYLRPSALTASGEAIRTFAYHEILIGYLDYCKKQGFVSCYLWSCPPRRGQDYLFYNHPENQRTPTAPKLTSWYQTMIQKAVKEKVIVSSSNVYDYHFRTSNGSGNPVSATRLPYFEGDSWFLFSGDVLKEVDKETKSNYQRKRAKTGPKHKAKAFHSADSLYDSKDFLFMQKLGKIIQPCKKDFIVMHLRHVCSHCRQAISSGRGWFCNGCTDFRLCERCYGEENSAAISHRSNKGKQHVLSEVSVDGLPSSTKDEDGPIENLMFRNRSRFLTFCQKNHYQFDSIRRAKHSTMMILHFLSHPNDLSECSICGEVSLSEECRTCETCPDLRVCPSCCKRRGFSHSHP